MTESTPSAPATAQPVSDLSGAPLPTARTLRRRRSLAAQLVRFVMLNFRIVRMIKH